MNSNIYKPSVRKRKAYWTAFVVFGNYIKLGIASYFFGEDYYHKKLSSLNQKSAERIKNTIVELQGLFVKVGQLISILSNILPDEFRAPLETLQDKNPARSYEEVAQTIQNQFGKPPKELFTSFERKPIAAASIGQVHKATIGDQAVAVKIQHANIEQIAQADLDIIKNLVAIFGFIWHIKGIEHTYEQVRLMIEDELDYEREAKAMQTIQKNLEKQAHLRVVIPKVFEEFCSPKVIVTQFCEGENIGHIEAWKHWNIDRNNLMQRFIELYCHTILVDGYYHADPHPGNILVNKEGEIILLDFGAVARLSPQMKAAIPELIQATIKNDNEKMVDAMRKMKIISTQKNAHRVAEKFLNTIKDFIENEVQFDNLNIDINIRPESIFKLISELDISNLTSTFQIPKDWVLLNRVIVLIAGLSNQVAPQFNPITTLAPYVKQHLLEQEDSLSKFLLDSIKKQAVTAISLPNDLSKFLNLANKGKLALEIQDLNSNVRLLYTLGQQILFALLFLANAYAAIHTNSTIRPKWYYFFTILTALFLLLFFKAWWKGRKR